MTLPSWSKSPSLPREDVWSISSSPQRCVGIAPVGPRGRNERSAAVRQDDENEQHAASLDAADHCQRLALERVALADDGYLIRDIAEMGSLSSSSFDSIPHDLVERAVAHHTDLAWVRLYIGRWLRAPVEHPDGPSMARTKGTPQGGVISPLLANLFLHYAFDIWMARIFPPSRSSDMRTMPSSTAGAGRRRRRCWRPSGIALQSAAWSFIR